MSTKHNNKLSSRDSPLFARKESTGFIKHRQNDIPVSLFPFRDFNESNQRAIAERGKGRGGGGEFFTESVGLIAPAVYCVLEQHWKAA